MKKLLLAVTALILSVNLSAQGPQRNSHREFDPEQMAVRVANEMKEELNLKDKQYREVYELYLKRGKEMKAEFAKFQGGRRNPQEGQQINREARREEMQKRQEAMNAELKKILTKKQYKKYEEMQKKQQQRRPQDPPQGRPQGMPYRPLGDTPFSGSEHR